MVRPSQFYSQTQHILLSAWGSLREEVQLVMFTLYVDDSGTAPDQPVAIASALFIPAVKTIALEKEWANFLAKYEIDEFHTSECVAGKPGTKFEGWDDDRKRKACARVRQIISKYATKALSFAVNKADYDEFVVPELRQSAGEFHYTYAVRNMFSYVERHAEQIGASDRLEYIFDWMGENRRNAAKKEIEVVMEQAEILNPGRYAGRYSFRKRQTIPALQCTDLLAWTCYQFARNVFMKTPLHPIAEEGFWEFDNRKDRQWMFAVSQVRKQLKEWAAKELADPRSQQRRKEWLESHPPKSALSR